MAVADTRTDALASADPAVNTRLATCGHRACKAFTGASAALKSSIAGVAVVTRLRAPGPAWSGRRRRSVNGSRHRVGAGVNEAADMLASPAPTCAAQAASCQAPSKAPIERPRAFPYGEVTPPTGPWLAIQSLRPNRAEVSRTGNHVPRRERRSPSLNEGELPCVQAKQRERRGPSACCSVGRDAFARRSRRHRAWPRCCVQPRRERAFVGESPGRTARHSLDEANRSLSAQAPPTMPIRRRSSNRGSPPSPLGVPVRSPTKESTPC
jgi:hypothetical protein